MYYVLMDKVKKESSRLPEQYQEIEYIGNSGTQYIDTDKYIYGNTDKVIIKFSVDDINATQRIFGGRSSTTSNTFTLETLNGKYRYGYYNKTTTTNVSVDTNIHTLIAEKGKFILDGVEIAGVAIANYKTPSTATILAVSGSSQVYISPSAKVYEYQYLKNDIVQQHLIPCFVKSTGEGGMYDIINDTFLHNAGTGDFILGNSIGTYEYKKYKIFNKTKKYKIMGVK